MHDVVMALCDANDVLMAINFVRVGNCIMEIAGMLRLA